MSQQVPAGRSTSDDGAGPRRAMREAEAATPPDVPVTDPPPEGAGGSKRRSSGVAPVLDAWPRWLPGPLELVLAALALALCAFSMVGGLRTRIINADDVALQGVLASWAAGEPHAAYVGSDNFLLHFPLYWATAGIDDPWRRVAWQAVVCNLVVIVGMVVALRHLARFDARTPVARLVAGYAPVLAWSALTLVPFGVNDPLHGDYFRSMNQLNVNLRHLETGLWLVLVVAVHVLLTRRGQGRPAYAALAARGAGLLGVGVALGLLFFSDPLFVYIGGGAYALAVVLAWALGRIGHGVTAAALAVLGVAMATMKVVTPLVKAWGLLPVSIVEEQVITRERLGGNLNHTVNGWFTQTHGDMGGVLIHDPELVPLGVNAVFALVLLAAAVFGVRRFFRHHGVLELHLAALVPLSALALTLTPAGGAPVNARYLYVGAVAMVPLAGWMLVRTLAGAPRLAALLCLGLAAVVALNAPATKAAIDGPRTSDATTRAVVAAARAEGATKGYLQYWSANPVSWYSNREVIGLPLACQPVQAADGFPTRISRYDWLINSADFDRPAKRTFLLLERDRGPDHSGFDMACFAQLVPSDRRVKTIMIDQFTEMQVYEGDIGRDLPRYVWGRPL
ncbi:hypothetical protein GCM10027418_09550 [Mariniluteicoccus endophyticus]